MIETAPPKGASDNIKRHILTTLTIAVALVVTGCAHITNTDRRSVYERQQWA
jgi:hypothetical protein